ncbi:DNA-formamidopyrimidine glycosylase [Prochlorococcus sp. MIT 1307]|uniref:DNA-formamidopyrimidine glycosylase n=1 Tax=Prochlorococcus sp. MIT 1307 TaxID=3096219 RepID=UPI002A763520|nr:DNA-formamidopyrimidine glycosylase [Prochlorococcus sp. MIT 1307]
MPELPEVETVRKGLNDRLADFCIERLEVCRERAIASQGGSKKFIKKMRGNFVGDWQRRGKYLIASMHREQLKDQKKIDLSSLCGWWGVHLRMTGQFQLHQKEIPACPHTRVRFWNKEGSELRFVDVRSFGQMWWIDPESTPEKVMSGLRNLGPEPFSKNFNACYLKQRLEGKSRSIKSALLDQSLVAGTGNIYADESLFDAGILPQKKSGQLKELELEKLCKSLIKVLRISIGKGGTTFSDFRDLEGVNGKYGGEAWVYRRNKKPCRKCGAIIQREKLSGRSTHWCPRCQM